VATQASINESKVEKAIRIVYKWFIFPFTAGFLIIFWLSAYLNNSRIIYDFTKTTMIINSIALLLVWLIISIIIPTEMFMLFP